jgi:hypothetical protein
MMHQENSPQNALFWLPYLGVNFYIMKAPLPPKPTSIVEIGGFYFYFGNIEFFLS